MPFLSDTQWRHLRQRQKLLGQEVLMYQRVMEGMRRGISLESLFKLTIRSVQKGLGFKRCGIFLVDSKNHAMNLALGVDKRGRFEKGKDQFPIVRRRNTNAFSDIFNGYLKYFFTNRLPQRQHKGDQQRVPVRSTAVVPIQVGGGKIIGALAVDQLSDKRIITRSDVLSLFNFATQVGMALQSLQAHEQVVQQSVTDPLTGLSNRRFFEKAMAEELKRCEKNGRSCSLVLADLDFFKRVNDTYGHDIGDEFLKHVARLLHSCVRGLDTVARIGGEEFAVLLPDTPPDSASFLVQRLLRQVRENPPRLPEEGSEAYPLTVSFGTTSYCGGKVDARKMFKLADQSLYQAKHHGRNCAGILRVLSGKKALARA
ncbi:MAG TPA: sensor domain-containing diguanylate cyclase [bacterium]|nr:sensor domain-containing diguanylate cyclase [bacterium]